MLLQTKFNYIRGVTKNSTALYTGVSITTGRNVLFPVGVGRRDYILRAIFLFTLYTLQGIITIHSCDHTDWKLLILHQAILARGTGAKASHNERLSDE